MIEINLDNYEAWFLDFHEGNLTDLQLVQLMAFLELHPELKLELESYEAIKLLAQEEKVSFNNKDSLKKNQESVTSQRFDETAVKYIEGELSEAEVKQVNDLVSRNVLLKKELDLFQKTILAPDYDVICDFKNELRRGSKTKPVFYWSAAAAIAVLVVSYFMLVVNSSHSGLAPVISSVHANFKKKISVFPETTSSKVALATVDKKSPIYSTSMHKSMQQEMPKVDKVEASPVSEQEPAMTDNSGSQSVAVSNSDSITIFYKNSYYDEMEVAMAEAVSPKDSVLSFRDNITSRIKTELLAEEMKDGDTYKERKTRFTWYDAALLAAKGFRKVTKKNIDVKKRYDEDDNLIAYEFTAGERNFIKVVKK